MIGGGILERVRAEQADLTLTRAQPANDDLQQGRFAGPIHSENTGDATADRQAHIVQSNHLTIPFRNVVEHDRWGLGHRCSRLHLLALADLTDIGHHSRVTSREFTRLIRI